PWKATGIDPEGIDLLMAETTARLSFPRPARTPAVAETCFEGMVGDARRPAGRSVGLRHGEDVDLDHHLRIGEFRKRDAGRRRTRIGKEGGPDREVLVQVV